MNSSTTPTTMTAPISELSPSSLLGIHLEKPVPKPHEYSGSLAAQIKSSAIVYDFCSSFPTAAKSSRSTRSRQKHSNAQQNNDSDSIFVKLPPRVYEKVLKLLKERQENHKRHPISSSTRSSRAVKKLFHEAATGASNSAVITRGTAAARGVSVASSSSSSTSWTPQEDELLTALVQTHGSTKKWSVIAAELGNNKTAKACRTRYNNQLNPKVKRGDWTAEEDALIIEMHETMGNQWTKISKLMKGRTANTIKNRWHGHIKKRIQKGLLKLPGKNKQQQQHTSQQISHNFSITVTASTPVPPEEAGMHQQAQPSMIAPATAAPGASMGGTGLHSSGASQGETQPFSTDYANNYFGHQDEFFKLEENNSSDFAPAVESNQNIFGITPSPKKRKRESDFFVVGKRIKLGTPPENLDLSALYAEEPEEDFTDPLQFEVSTPVNGSGIQNSAMNKRAPQFDNLTIDVSKEDEENQFQTPSHQMHHYPTSTVVGSTDRSSTSSNSHNATSYDMLSFTISPSNLSTKGGDLNLWSPKSDQLFNTSHSPSKHFLRLGSHL